MSTQLTILVPSPVLTQSQADSTDARAGAQKEAAGDCVPPEAGLEIDAGARRPRPGIPQRDEAHVW